jgi:hypothetical protein
MSQPYQYNNAQPNTQNNVQQVKSKSRKAQSRGNNDIRIKGRQFNCVVVAGLLFAILIAVIAVVRKYKQGFRAMAAEGNRYRDMAPQQHGVYITLPPSVKIVATNPSTRHSKHPSVLVPAHASLSNCYLFWSGRMRQSFNTADATSEFYSLIQRQDPMAKSKRLATAASSSSSPPNAPPNKQVASATANPS